MNYSKISHLKCLINYRSWDVKSAPGHIESHNLNCSEYVLNQYWHLTAKLCQLYEEQMTSFLWSEISNSNCRNTYCINSMFIGSVSDTV